MKDELKHYRTPGSKNGVRLYQYKDGSLTPAGKQRYLKGNQWHNRISNTHQNKQNGNSVFKNIVKYTPGKIGVGLRAGYDGYNAVRDYYDNLDRTPSYTIPEYIVKAKEIREAVEPYKYQLDKSVYFAKKSAFEIARNTQNIDAGSEHVQQILAQEEYLKERLNNPSLIFLDLIKYLHKKSKEAYTTSHKNGSPTKSSYNWRSFGGERPKPKQTK